MGCESQVATAISKTKRKDEITISLCFLCKQYGLAIQHSFLCPNCFTTTERERTINYLHMHVYQVRVIKNTFALVVGQEATDGLRIRIN
jgi:hypothetical protein